MFSDLIKRAQCPVPSSSVQPVYGYLFYGYLYGYLKIGNLRRSNHVFRQR